MTFFFFFPFFRVAVRAPKKNISENTTDAVADSLFVDRRSFSSFVCDFSWPTRRSPLRRAHPRVEQKSRHWGRKIRSISSTQNIRRCYFSGPLFIPISRHLACSETRSKIPRTSRPPPIFRNGTGDWVWHSCWAPTTSTPWSLS